MGEATAELRQLREDGQGVAGGEAPPPSAQGLGRADGDAPARPAPAYLDEAKALYEVLTDGAPAAGYNVARTFAVRDAAKREPLYSSYTAGWRPARDRYADGTEVDRPLNPYVLAQHLRGRYDVGWTAPSWTSLVVFDIDRPDAEQPGDVEAELAADLARDRMLAAVWDAFGCDADKQPVLLRTPGDGYHVYLPLLRSRDPAAKERTWPAAWAREQVEHVLNGRGLDLSPGRLELFPSGVRLRAPCGHGTALLRATNPNHSDNLGLELVHARWVLDRDPATGAARARIHRSIGPMAGAFLDAVAGARRPLDEWTAGPPWSQLWGPWADRAARPEKNAASVTGPRALSPHKEETLGWPGLPSGPKGNPLPSGKSGSRLLFRVQFRRCIAGLLVQGLTRTKTRHDSILKLMFYLCVVRGLSKDNALATLRDWLGGHDHDSATRRRSPRAFLLRSMREAAHYYDTRLRHIPTRGGGGPALLVRGLHEPDEHFLRAKLPPEMLGAARAVLGFLAAAADSRGRVPHPVDLPKELLSALCGEARVLVPELDGRRRRRRVTVVLLEELLKLGLLTLHTDYSTGRHGRRYCCWYVFGSGEAPALDDHGRLVLGRRALEEGELVVVSDGSRRPPSVELLVDPERRSSPPAENLWWMRMYNRRAFTPAEFFEGDSRVVLPGPFRHQFPRKSKATAGSPALSPAPRSHDDPPTASPGPDGSPPSNTALASPASPPDVASDVTARLAAMLAAAAESEAITALLTASAELAAPTEALAAVAATPDASINASPPSTAHMFARSQGRRERPTPRSQDPPHDQPDELEEALAKAWAAFLRRS